MSRSSETVNTSVETELLEFARSVGQLVRRVRGAAANEELSWSESAILGRLDKAGPATAADLAREEGMKPQSMGTTIAALEERGLIVRKSHPSDGRQMIISLTPLGVETRKRALDAKLQWLRLRFEKLSERERATLFSAGKVIRQILENESR